MRVLEGSNRVRNGLMGIILLVVVIGVGQSFASVPMLFATPTYYAQFADTGGIPVGPKGTAEIATYTSLTEWNGERILWYPDRKYFLLGKRIGDEWFAGMNVPQP